ncbi:cytochrome P450 [Antrihabitans sp. YC2-6]|uniref:cytochrome P450 n=1 Tax=Antrihabitans sp. YC2-6 TaxID=2799498 RepID=UPI0018F300BF|nr:cytochrome P450 [Antrihabitans sp. YC2-6]MBJ8343543.1 cytochrome P450 [Antrihabitans sp. YC2-6]
MTISINTAPVQSNSVEWNEEFGIFVATGFDAVSAVLRGTGWSSDPRKFPQVPAEIQELPATILLFMDPPDHGELRRLLSPAFTPRSIERVRSRVVAVVDAALDAFEGDEVELMSDFAYLVPIAVIAELLDVGPEGAELFLDETPALVKMLELDATPEELAASVDASIEIMLGLTPIIAERKNNLGDDLLSQLLSIDGISIDEVASTLILLLAAGHETTANLIGNGTLAIANQPAQKQHLLADPARAVEELLRLEGPVKRSGRLAVVDQNVGGIDVPAGSYIYLDLQQANVDPAHFDDPLRLDLSREPKGHLAFGAGAHFCIGASLARLEAAEALSRLFTRFPDLAVPPEPAWRTSMTFHALDELPVALG